MIITSDLLLRLGWDHPEDWAAELGPACERHAINTRERVAMALANFTHETGGGRRLVESLDYRPDVLLRQWPKHFTAETAQQLGRTPGKPADQEGIANAAYGGRMGNLSERDGWLYRGRGLIQTTGRDAYAKTAMVCKRPLAGLPAWMETRAGAAETACALWEWAGCNKLADADAVTQCRAILNVGHWPVKESAIIGLDDVREIWERAKRALGAA